MDIKTIQSYYNNNQFWYSLLWSGRYLHFGFWENGITTHKESLENTNAFIAERLQLQEKDTVLDAGCGAGGVSIYFAEKQGAEVTGITLSEVQLKKANLFAKKSFAQKKMKFFKADYHKTILPDQTFNKIIALESFCHATDKEVFLKEMYRLLKPGSKLVVADAFVTKIKTTKEKNIMNDFLQAWAAPPLPTQDEFSQSLNRAGFKNITLFNKSVPIRKSIQRAYNRGILFYPFSLIFSKLKIIPENWHGHCVGAIKLKFLFDNNILEYLVVTAEK